MRISDMLRQYNQNVSNGTEELRSAQGTQKLVSTVGELSAGSVFEGTVNGVKGGKVTLALGNGQVITARLDGKVDIKPGTAMFFQVKENDGQTVAIRPYSGAGSAGNPILLDALTSAQVPVTDRALLMADTMMQEGMSINRENILAMLKYVNANPNANVQTIVQMVKLGLPVTEIMASQYENYLSGNHALVGELELAVKQLSEALADGALSKEEALALYTKITDIFFGEGAHSEGKLPMEGLAGAQAENPLANGMGQQGAVPENGAMQNGGAEVAEPEERMLRLAHFSRRSSWSFWERHYRIYLCLRGMRPYFWQGQTARCLWTRCRQTRRCLHRWPVRRRVRRTVWRLGWRSIRS